MEIPKIHELSKPLTVPELYEKYDPDLELRNGEIFDLYALDKNLPIEYRPGENPQIAVVGASEVKESSLIKKHFKKSFDINPENVTTTAMNLNPDIKLNDEYSNIQLGQEGDASKPENWDSSKGNLDMVYIRNPDFSNLDTWQNVFNNAYDSLKKGGALVIMSREEDAEAMDHIVSREELKFTPKVDKETGTSNIDDVGRNTHRITVALK